MNFRFLIVLGIACANLCCSAAQARPNAMAPKPGLANQVRDTASGMVIAALNFLDIRYRSGGNNAHEGFDCSGFTRHLFATSRGIVLPRRAEEQAHAPSLSHVKRSDLEPGDLVFFNTLRRTFSHVGIYVGEGKFIHAPRAGAYVRVENMQFAYWAKRFTGARRPKLDLADAAAIRLPAQSAKRGSPFDTLNLN
jgi:cell wall-associated NlpC family hydrolase